ncbi:MAG: VWA domain-containing protein [Armatimonadetes bacterium]|nr:VWA domain-containing protein [Armatimonadota bacterium]
MEMLKNLAARILGYGSEFHPASPAAVEHRKNHRKKRKQRQLKRSVPDFMRVLEQSRENAHTGVEASARSLLVDSFLKASHGDLESFGKLHLAALEKDPIFYGHLARWYLEKGAIRDHHELFSAHLLTSPFPEHRAHGTVLLQHLRPYQVTRVVKYCKEALHFTTRALKSAVKFYLRRREENPQWFDEHVIRRRDAIKYLYTTLHLKPSERAEKILFEESPPPESRVAVVREIAAMSDSPQDQARLIVKNRIHYTAAIGAIRHFTPGILYALAYVMTPQQVINHLKFFEKRGAFGDRDTRAVIEEKLRYGAKESRVSDFKSLVALSSLNADANLAQELLEITQKRIRNRGEIKAPTALLVDKSGSMEQCIQIGKLLATMCSTLAVSDLYVYAFDTNAFEVKCVGREFGAWERAFSPIQADNATSIGSPFRHLIDKEVEQVVVISDGEENTPPRFVDMLTRYEKEHGRPLKVFFVKVGENKRTPLEEDMGGRDFTMFHFDGDYYNLPNVIPLLCSGNSFELVEEVLSLPLFGKNDLAHLPPGFDGKTYEIL